MSTGVAASPSRFLAPRWWPAWFLLGLLLSGVVGGPYLILLPVDSSYVSFEIFLLLVALGGGGGVLAASTLLPVPRARRLAMPMLFAMAGIAAGGLGALVVGGDLRMPKIQALGESARPVVEALRAYEREQGRPARSLEALVPDYLAELPYVEYEYEYRWFAAPLGSFDDSSYPEPHGRTTWELRIDLGWDPFFYWPLGNYPDRIYGGRVDRLGDWSYVHE